MESKKAQAAYESLKDDPRAQALLVKWRAQRREMDNVTDELEALANELEKEGNFARQVHVLRTADDMIGTALNVVAMTLSGNESQIAKRW